MNESFCSSHVKWKSHFKTNNHQFYHTRYFDEYTQNKIVQCLSYTVWLLNMNTIADCWLPIHPSTILLFQKMEWYKFCTVVFFRFRGSECEQWATELDWVRIINKANVYCSYTQTSELSLLIKATTWWPQMKNNKNNNNFDA